MDFWRGGQGCGTIRMNPPQTPQARHARPINPDATDTSDSRARVFREGIRGPARIIAAARA